LTFTDITSATDQNKENQINLSNQNLHSYASKTTVQPCPRSQKMKKLLNEKIMENYTRVDKNMKKLNLMEKQIHLNESSPGMRKIEIIEKLTKMMETNKNMRIREMFEERQRLS
jgi:hypothetical protein